MNNQTNEAVAYDENSLADACFAMSVNGEGSLYCPKCGNGQPIYLAEYDVTTTKAQAVCANCIDNIAVITPNTITILESEYAKLKADAERYRFIRSQTSNIGIQIDGIDEGLALESLDEAIDQSRNAK